tara:strand:- start:3890 stop:5200 length:1311 start_codon:yes stop_codon:yes gene_type:complete
MINLIRKLLILHFLIFFYTPLYAFSSSSFLISQSAFKNHDYLTAISDYSGDDIKLSNTNLLDKVISAVIIEDIDLAHKISSEILLEDSANQEAYIVKLVYLYANKKFKRIKKIHQTSKDKNELVDFIFFNNEELKNNSTISKSLVDVVISSFSSSEQKTLNYNFLLFYTSLAKIIDNTNDRATLIKGELFQNVAQSKVAEKNYLMIEPNSSFYLEAQKSLAVNYSNFLQYDEALIKIKKLLQKNNDHYTLKKILADFYRVNKKFELAITLYSEMVTQQEDDLWNIYYRRGICHERLGDWKNAEKDFLTSLDIKPDSANVLNYLAYGWVEREIRLEQSLEMLEAAYNANPESYYIIDSLAWAHFKKNNLNEAARLMEMVIDMAPGEAISLDHLGDIYYAMGRKREAIHFWQQALELAEPEDEIEEDVSNKLIKFNAG